MFGGGVTLLRSAVRSTVASALVGSVSLGAAAASASAATGGAAAPEGVVIGPSTAPAVAAPTPPTETAAQVALTPPTPALPILATQARRPEDPVAQDLAALIEPSPVAAIDGHVVYTRQHMGRTELVDVANPASPRILLSGTRVFGAPAAGEDGRGRPVAVLSTCAGTEEVVMQGQAPRCPLRAVDLVDGSSRALPSTTGALSGDLAGDQLVFTRRGGTDGVRLYLASGNGLARAVALPRLGRTGDGWLPAHGKPLAGGVRVSALDVDATGRIAVVLEYRAKAPAYSSSLWVRSAEGRWRRITTLGTRLKGQGARQVLAPQLDDGGVRAYVEGLVETPSFAGRWTEEGAVTAQQSVRRSIGRATILHSAAYDADRLVFVDWLPGVPCGSEGALACGLRALGPVAVG